jgi:hypothetical protein
VTCWLQISTKMFSFNSRFSVFNCQPKQVFFFFFFHFRVLVSCSYSNLRKLFRSLCFIKKKVDTPLYDVIILNLIFSRWVSACLPNTHTEENKQANLCMLQYLDYRSCDKFISLRQKGFFLVCHPQTKASRDLLLAFIWQHGKYEPGGKKSDSSSL